MVKWKAITCLAYFYCLYFLVELMTILTWLENEMFTIYIFKPHPKYEENVFLTHLCLMSYFCGHKQSMQIRHHKLQQLIRSPISAYMHFNFGIEIKIYT